jgi:hypothetical protein
MDEQRPKHWLKPIANPKGHPCLCCGRIDQHLPPSALIAVGFGYAALERDGLPIWTEPMSSDTTDEDLMTCEGAEKVATAWPFKDCDWRIKLEGPLSGRTYQRQGPGNWVLVKQNTGFA